MGWIIAALLLLLVFGGIGFAWHAFWWIALIALIVVIAIALTRGPRV